MQGLARLEALSGNEQLVAVYTAREMLLANRLAWSAAAESIKARSPRWGMLGRLLRHARDLLVAVMIGPQVEAVAAQRSLLALPDPVAPPWDEVAGALRAELQRLRAELAAERERAMAWLGGQEAWMAIEEYDRQRLMREFSLTPVRELSIGDDEELLKTLDAAPLEDWRDKLAALSMRMVGARDEAVRLLQPEAVIVRPKAATLKTAAEATAYLDALRAEIMGHIEAGRPVLV